MCSFWKSFGNAEVLHSIFFKWILYGNGISSAWVDSSFHFDVYTIKFSSIDRYIYNIQIVALYLVIFSALYHLVVHFSFVPFWLSLVAIPSTWNKFSLTFNNSLRICVRTACSRCVSSQFSFYWIWTVLVALFFSLSLFFCFCSLPFLFCVYMSNVPLTLFYLLAPNKQKKKTHSEVVFCRLFFLLSVPLCVL